MKKQHNHTVIHWGMWQVEGREDDIVAVNPVPWGKNPSCIGQSPSDVVTSQTHIRRPAVRASYLQQGPTLREGRDKEPFVEVSWEVALDLLAHELHPVKACCGNEAIYGGSYSWASAGCLHHAQSRLHRFLEGLGGYTASTNTYSSAASERILPHIPGSLSPLHRQHIHFPELARECQLFVVIGGLPLRNAQVNGGGANDHMLPYWSDKMQANGTRFINISPVRNDLSAVPDAEWLVIRPGTDIALLLALSYVPIAEPLYDQTFVASHTAGFAPYRAYLLGEHDGVAKTPAWAAAIIGLDVQRIVGLAREMARHWTIVNTSWSIQHARQGEQTYWATVTLTVLLGQVGTSGGGLGLGYACTNLVGAVRKAFSGPRLPAGENAVDGAIPVVRPSDILLYPGEAYEFDGQQLRYLDIRLVYWTGGNASHHYQDINRLRKAWRRPEMVVVHEQYQTVQVKFSDIVLPVATSLEREDIGSGGHDGFMIVMSVRIPPVGEARDGYAIFHDLTGQPGFGEQSSEGRDIGQRLCHLCEESGSRVQEEGIALPSFEDLWQRGVLEYSVPRRSQIFLADFRVDPQRYSLSMPSGKIGLLSATVAGLGYRECPGHSWWDGGEAARQRQEAARWPLHLLPSQPRARLHSQYDYGSVSRAMRIQEHESLWMHPSDTQARDACKGSVVKVYNDRGAILTGVHLSERILPGVVRMSTGAWYDPLDPNEKGTLDKHGNPNVLTEDHGSSCLGWGCSTQSCWVEIAPWRETLPPITAFDPSRSTKVQALALAGGGAGSLEEVRYAPPPAKPAPGGLRLTAV